MGAPVTTLMATGCGEPEPRPVERALSSSSMLSSRTPTDLAKLYMVRASLIVPAVGPPEKTSIGSDSGWQWMRLVIGDGRAYSRHRVDGRCSVVEGHIAQHYENSGSVVRPWRDYVERALCRGRPRWLCTFSDVCPTVSENRKPGRLGRTCTIFKTCGRLRRRSL